MPKTKRSNELKTLGELISYEFASKSADKAVKAVSRLLNTGVILVSGHPACVTGIARQCR